MIYLADFSTECSKCDATPCVTVRDLDIHGTQLHDTGLCGIHFFRDRSMIDPELWNEPQEATE